MSTIENSITINAPAAQVAAFVSDIRNAPTYISDLSNLRGVRYPSGAQEGESAVGTIASFDARFMGSTTILDLRIDRYQSGPPTILTLVSDENNAVIEISVAPQSTTSTVLTTSISVPVPTFLLNMMFGSSMKQGLAQAKRILEQQ